MIKIGIDFDNTLVCYDALFYRVACEKMLIPDTVTKTKQSVRDYLRQHGKESVWTELQGYVYGPRMIDAPPFPGVQAFFSQNQSQNMQFFIISHKTRYPFAGPKYDLHQAARNWLKQYGFNDYVPNEQIYFELTKQDKLNRIKSTGVDYFIDDLPEILTEPEFPATVSKILFDPNRVHSTSTNYKLIFSWAEMDRVFLSQ